LAPAIAAALLGIAAEWRAACADDAPAEKAATGEAPQVSPAAELAAAAIHVPEGFTVTAVASEPRLANPVAFCFDPAGRIFVAETHRVGKGVEDNRHHMYWLDDDLAARTVGDRREFMIRHKGDAIGDYTDVSEIVRLLEDRDGDGRYEHSSVFSGDYKEVETGAAAGVMWSGDRLLFTCIPSLWELRDDDGDGKAEHRRELATGFGVHVAFYGHDMHGLTPGPDGKIYFSIGDRGLHVETPEGRTLSNPDSGAVLRCNPDGSELEIFATGLRNPQELAFNEFGDLFTVDNNSDSGDLARLVHVVEGMDAGWRMFYQYLPDRGPFNREKVWHTQNPEQPASIVPPLTHISDGPSGLVYYPGTGMTAEDSGSFFLVDFRPGKGGVRQFWTEPDGATYRLAREKLFAENVLATDCEFGPDGAMYIADWISGWDGTGQGRIHRVTSGDADAAAAAKTTAELLERVDKLQSNELLPLLGHANMRVRLAAQQRLVAAGPGAAAALLQTASSIDTTLMGRIHAIWALGQLSEQAPELLAQLSNLAADGHPEVRAQVARTLGRGMRSDQAVRRELGERLIPLLADESPRVRSLASISLGKLQHRPALAALLKLAQVHAERDPVLRHATAVALAESQTPEDLIAAASGADSAERLAITVALGRQRSPLVAKLLQDDSERVRLEAARLIWDFAITDAYKPLAAALADVVSANEPMLRRALAANLAMRSPAHLEAVIDAALREDLSPAMRELAWQLVGDWARPSPRDSVLGLWRPLPELSGADVRATVERALPKLIEAGGHGGMGLVVAAELGVADAIPAAAKVVSSHQYDPAIRARALASIRKADKAIVSEAIEAAMNSGEPTIRSAARQLILERFPERALHELRDALAAATTEEQQAVMSMLPSLKSSEAHALLAEWFDRLERGECPPELQLDVLEAVDKSRDPGLRERLEKYQASIAGDDPTRQYAASLLGGDAERGRRVFDENTSLACKRCHASKAGEPRVGPNLADVGIRLSRTELLESIVKPNAKITEGFQTTVLQLDTGKVVAGILRSKDDKHIVLVDPDGKEIVVDGTTVEDEFEGLSSMPEDLMKLMTPRELRDLVEYLSQLRTPATVEAAAANAQDPTAHGDGT
jgi:quinoprotein glucose dehydrogenase